MSDKPQTTTVAIKLARYFEKKYHLKHYGNLKPDANNILYCVEDAEKAQNAFNNEWNSALDAATQQLGGSVDVVTCLGKLRKL